MKEHNSCQQSVAECIEKQYFSIAHLHHVEKTLEMHIHNCYEIYYSISGGKQFLIDNKFYNINSGDIFFINQYESHYLSEVDNMTHDRIVISIYPEFLASLSSSKTDLNHCFTSRNNVNQHKLTLSSEVQKRFLYFIHKLCTTEGYGSDLLERAVFTELMIFLNKLFDTTVSEDEHETNCYHKQVDDILLFINSNLSKPLTIESLASHFYLSSSYICRIFKSTTGTTINKYITARRISVAKTLLTAGKSVTEACELSGFNDYSNFLKSFTKSVGISPKKYAQNSI